MEKTMSPTTRQPGLIFIKLTCFEERKEKQGEMENPD